MIEINVCPSTLEPNHNTYSARARRNLFDGQKVSHIFAGPAPEANSPGFKETAMNVSRISLSGAQPKFAAIVDPAAGLRYAREGEKGTFILKPKPISYTIVNKEFCAADEHLTMQIARQVYKLPTAENALCFFADGSPAYITKRFDITEGKKNKQEDFATLMGYTKDNAGSNYKYSRGSYEDCADIIRQYVKASAIDLRIFFRLILFNFITLNDDAHLKNFSLLEQNGEYRLSPAYDLVNTSFLLWEPQIFALEKGLFREGMQLSDVRQICRADFEEFGRRIGLPPTVVRKDIDRFIQPDPLFDDLILRSFLSRDLKENYAASSRYRRKMLSW